MLDYVWPVFRISASIHGMNGLDDLKGADEKAKFDEWLKPKFGDDCRVR